MKMTPATLLFFLVLLAIAGCGTAPNPNDAGGVPCDGSSCEGDAPPESVCLEHIAAEQWDDGCGVFTSRMLGVGDDTNPGTKERPVSTIQHAIELARTGRGRVFVCLDVFEGAVTLPSGVDLVGGFQCIGWYRHSEGDVGIIQATRDGTDIGLTIEPARDGDTGAADGVSKIIGMRIYSRSLIGAFVRSGSVVEFLHSEIVSSNGFFGRHGSDGPNDLPPDGAHGGFGADACSAAVVTGGAAAMTACGEGVFTRGGKGGDGYPNEGGAGDDGAPRPMNSSDRWGTGGRGDTGDDRCEHGVRGLNGAQGTHGAAGQGAGRIGEAGWEGGKAGDGGRGAPGGSGGGGGGRRGGIALCGAANKGGASGGAGGAGGCGGVGGKGGENGPPSLGILALHAKVTVRDTLIRTLSAGRGGNGGEPQSGGYPGHGAPGGSFADDRRRACTGGEGGFGGPGGYGGGGRGGDSIGIAYLDEDQLVVGEGVTFELGEPGKGGLSLSGDPTKSGAYGVAYETFRFPE